MKIEKVMSIDIRVSSIPKLDWFRVHFPESRAYKMYPLKAYKKWKDRGYWWQDDHRFEPNNVINDDNVHTVWNRRL